MPRWLFANLKVMWICHLHRNSCLYWRKTAAVWGRFFTYLLAYSFLASSRSFRRVNTYRCVRSGVVLMKHIFPHGGQSWAPLRDCFLLMAQLLTLKVRIKGLAAFSGWFLAEPTKYTTKPSWRQSWLVHRLWRLTALRPRTFLLEVAVSGPRFIARHHLLQLWIELYSRFADGIPVNGVFSR